MRAMPKNTIPAINRDARRLRRKKAAELRKKELL